MRSQALLGAGLTSPTCRPDANSLQPAPAIRLVRLTPSRAARGARRISWTGGTLRRSRAHFQPTLGRSSRRVRGIYAGLSNTRYPFQRRAPPGEHLSVVELDVPAAAQAPIR